MFNSLRRVNKPRLSGISTIWSSLLSCVGLFIVSMGQSHIRLLDLLIQLLARVSS
jgi:hypothetical protein